ncbi:hypothetical protein FQA47_007220 [Oryzias melastigma]|uniref:Uncharacterized protein n=1 Tax=Oryzias melastigma TaxID=30732 RepID=A0A834BL94_ORYME|nr:hypothetical protein FQA47_007220 [Oryzias melastigma]
MTATCRVKALTRNVPVRDIPSFLSWAKTDNHLLSFFLQRIHTDFYGPHCLSDLATWLCCSRATVLISCWLYNPSPQPVRMPFCQASVCWLLRLIHSLQMSPLLLLFGSAHR